MRFGLVLKMGGSNLFQYFYHRNVILSLWIYSSSKLTPICVAGECLSSYQFSTFNIIRIVIIMMTIIRKDEQKRLIVWALRLLGLNIRMIARWNNSMVIMDISIVIWRWSTCIGVIKFQRCNSLINTINIWFRYGIVLPTHSPSNS